MKSIFENLKIGPRLRGAALASATLCLTLGLDAAIAQSTSSPASSAAESTTPESSILLTVFFKHDQSRPLSELNAQLAKQGFYKAFPPQGVEVVSWYVVMGIGQVITLRVPASRLRDVNRVLEDSAWGSYRTEFYATYDYKAIGMAAHANGK